VDAITGLTPTQLAAMSCAGVQSLTSAQVDAMSDEQLLALNFSTPLALDLTGDGLQTTAAEHGVPFDLCGFGVKKQVGWIAPSDGLLVLDVNGDGVINDGTELFGSGTRLADGSTAADGFIALVALNSNPDGVIDANDAAFARLQVWQDANQDGVSDASELMALAALNIVSLALDADETAVMNNGNIIKLESSYTTTDGVTHQLVDVWLAGAVDAVA
jgi:hypothetical protein